MEMSKVGNKISDKFSKDKTVFSVEFFPPKTEEGARLILKTAEALSEARPDYVSITYGAGGSTRGRTLEYGLKLKRDFGFEVMPHLACCGHSRDQIRSILENFQSEGFDNVMALRGDPPKGEANFAPCPDGFAHASELIEFISSDFPEFGIGCAGYPEKHPEAPSIGSDIAFLREKVDKGADMIVTQMFFDNSHFFEFVKKCRKAGIFVPIVAGLLPPLSLKQLDNFKRMSSSEIPAALVDKMSAARTDDEARRIGRDWTRVQIEELISRGVDGIHLYILNRAESALELAKFVRG